MSQLSFLPPGQTEKSFPGVSLGCVTVFMVGVTQRSEDQQTQMISTDTAMDTDDLLSRGLQGQPDALSEAAFGTGVGSGHSGSDVSPPD